MYAEPRDLIIRFTAKEFETLLGLERGVAPDESDQRLIAACIDAAAIADSYLGRVITLPLTSIPAALVAATADIARYRLHKDQVKEGGDEGKTTIRLRYEDAIKWLELVAEGKTALFAGKEMTAEPDAPFPMRKNSRIAIVASPVVFDQGTLGKMDAVRKH